jgi:galactokinase
MTDLTALRKEFLDHFAAAPAFYHAPGRVNLIGEHTDYNAGFVMPVAIQFYTTVAIAPRADRKLRVHSTNFAETVEADLPDPNEPIPRRSGQRAQWIDYVLGVARALEQHGIPLTGADLLIHGEVPLGAGLSSSAALEVAVALALTTQAGHTLDKVTLAKIGQQAENEYVGMRCGIMDQFAAANGRAGHALKIDCRSLEHELVPLDPHTTGANVAVQLVICNTMVRHRLAGGEYNRRREECERGVRSLQQVLPGIQALRDVSIIQLERHATLLDPVVFRRCRHIITENARVLAAAAALKAGALETVGLLMRESHTSMRDDYEISCHELDLMVCLAELADGVYGARMTGGGFGGCTVNLVRADKVMPFRAMIAARYAAATGHTPEIYVCEAADGAAPVQFPEHAPLPAPMQPS